jgi:hypothetical protein
VGLGHASTSPRWMASASCACPLSNICIALHRVKCRPGSHVQEVEKQGSARGVVLQSVKEVLQVGAANVTLPVTLVSTHDSCQSLPSPFL